MEISVLSGGIFNTDIIIITATLSVGNNNVKQCLEVFVVKFANKDDEI